MRTSDLDIICNATKQYAHRITGFYPVEWIADTRNIALTNEQKDVILLEYETPGVRTGHWFFWSRGRQAVKSAKAFLKEVFETTDTQVIRGLTPLGKLGARWLNRQVGATSYGIVQTRCGPCELVILTKQEWEAKQ